MKIWVPVLLLGLLSLSAIAKTPDSLVPKPAPDFNLPQRAGNVSLDSLRGKVVLVDFWASWCAPCRKSFPWMTTMHARYSDKGLVIVAVNLDKSRDAADSFLDDFEPPFTIAFDPEGKTAEAFDVPTMPSSFLIDRSGKIIYSHAGFDPRNTDEMETQIKEACSR